MLERRWISYPLLLLVGLVLFLPSLGDHSLWEEDEAHNAQCVREMQDAQTWVVPTFNFKLRPDKPVLQYWCIRASYLCLGVSEWSARLPSVLASLISLLLTYELGRTLFCARTGFVAGLLLGSSVLFNISAHAVTPDAFLIVTILAGLLAFAVGYKSGGNAWLLFSAVASALAVLAKGPVGLVLPSAIVLCFLAWQRDLSRLWRWQLAAGIVVFLAIALPWYILVGLETRFEFIRGFFFKHNLSRFQAAMEGHTGGFWYHPLVLFFAFAPASVFLIVASIAAWIGEPRPVDPTRWQQRTDRWQYRFLGCWCVLWLSFFSAAATKLPNYLLPMYPALAVLVSRFLVRWLGGDLRLPVWTRPLAWGGFALVGLVIGLGLLLASGTLPGIDLKGREIPPLRFLAAVGLVPILASGLAWYWQREGKSNQALAAFVGGSCITVGLLAAIGPGLMQGSRAIESLAKVLNGNVPAGDVLIGCHQCYHPSLVFYTNRQVMRGLSDARAIDLLRCPWPAFLIIRESDWPKIAVGVPSRCRVLAAAREFKAGEQLLLVFNHGSTSVAYSLPSSAHSQATTVTWADAEFPAIAGPD